MDDLISRQAAIDALQKEINKGIPPFDDVMGSIRCGVRLARNIIEDLPSVQHEPHEGHWIPVHPIQSDDPGAYMCSKCKTGMWEIRPSAYHYCPNCGAEMSQETDNG